MLRLVRTADSEECVEGRLHPVPLIHKRISQDFCTHDPGNNLADFPYTSYLYALYSLLSPFLVLCLLSSYCRSRELLLHLNTLIDTHTHTHSVGLPWTRDRPLSQADASTCTTHNIHRRHTWPRRNSNPQYQHICGRRPTPQSARPSGSAL